MACIASSGVAAASPTGLDLRWRGVALDDLPGDEMALLADAIPHVNPARLSTTISVSWLESTKTSVAAHDITSSEIAATPRHLIQIVGRDARFATELDPGTQVRPPLGVVVVEAILPRARSAAPELRVVREAPLATLDLEIEVSLVDRLTFVGDERFGFARTYPSGVGALDEIRRPGYLTSLTPATELGRISRQSSHRSLSSPAWSRGKPYLPFEIPWVAERADGTRRWYVKTRVAFHIWQGRAFSRGFNSYGCVTLRDTDLDELADLVFSRADPLPLRVSAPALSEHRHPLRHEGGHHWVLENLGTDENPRIIRGTLYAIKKLEAPPPQVDAMIGVFMDAERRRPTLGPVAVYPDRIPRSLMP